MFHKYYITAFRSFVLNQIHETFTQVFNVTGLLTINYN